MRYCLIAVKVVFKGLQGVTDVKNYWVEDITEVSRISDLDECRMMYVRFSGKKVHVYVVQQSK